MLLYNVKIDCNFELSKRDCMELTQIAGYIGALFIGIVLGLTGGGGSILTVPVLVYLLHVNPITATAYSLFIVGSSSLVGTLKNIKSKMIDFKTAIIFAIPAFITVYLTRRFVIPIIPDNITSIGGVLITKDIAIMLFFAIVMVLSSFSMIRGKGVSCDQEDLEVHYNIPLIILVGLAVGLVSGLVGAGGGFLIIPALVILAKLPRMLPSSLRKNRRRSSDGTSTVHTV